MSEILKYNSTAMSYFQLFGKQAGSTMSTTHAGSSGSGRQILGLVGKTGPGEQDPRSPNRAGRNAALEGLARRRTDRLQSMQTPLRQIDVLYLASFIAVSKEISWHMVSIH